MKFFKNVIALPLNIVYGRMVVPVVSLWLRSRGYSTKPLKTDCKKILINFQQHHFVGLGDAVMFSSIFKIVKYRYPHAQLFLLTSRGNKYNDLLWRDHTYVDEFLYHPPVNPFYVFHWIAFYAKLRKKGFDASIVQVHKSVVNRIWGSWFPLDPLINWVCGIPTTIGFYDRWPQNQFIHSIIDQFGLSEGKPVQNIPHWTDIAIEYAKALDIPEHRHLNALSGHVTFKQVPILEAGRKMVVINPGGNKNFDRRWPLEKFKALCIQLSRRCKIDICLIGGPDEQDIRAELATMLNTADSTLRVKKLSGNDLNETLNHIAQSEAYVGNDTGTTHLAAAIDCTPVIAIFGPTDETYWGPKGIRKTSQVIYLDIPCRPCDQLYEAIGHKECHLPESESKHKCLKELPVNDVFKAVEKILIQK